MLAHGPECVVSVCIFAHLPQMVYWGFDFTSNFLTNDGSNACVYLCTKIADELLNSDIFNKDDVPSATF